MPARPAPAARLAVLVTAVLIAVVFTGAVLVAAVHTASGGRRGDERLARDASSPHAEVTAPAPAEAPTTTGAPPAPDAAPRVPPAPAPPGSPRDVAAVVTPTGVVLPVVAVGPDGAYRVRTPCGGEADVAGATPVAAATVVLDPGHGGVETGTVGPNGLVERDLNLAVAQRTRDHLEAAGETVVLTRTADYRITLQVRGEIVQRLAPRAFVSIHHNGGGDHLTDRPGTETYYQIGVPESKRLAGLVYEEVFGYFASLPVPEGFRWEADFDAGVKYRAAEDGTDYYGILRRSAGVPAALSEAAFLHHGPEAELLARPEIQDGEAQALTRAIRRFLTTSDAGSGFVEPYDRTEPAGGGGGSTGCVDPPLQ